MRKILPIAICAMLFFPDLNAQTNTVTGNVVSADDGMGIIGATIVVKGDITTGTITDVDGNFQISCSANDTLVFSFIGMATQEIPVDGKTTIDVILEMEKIQLEEIVVTALGMKREKKALGYSVQEVDGAEVQATKELNLINSLAGRAAGVNVTQGGGGLNGGGARIVIRGETSLAGNNTPLFVIDGIPWGI